MEKRKINANILNIFLNKLENKKLLRYYIDIYRNNVKNLKNMSNTIENLFKVLRILQGKKIFTNIKSGI